MNPTNKEPAPDGGAVKCYEPGCTACFEPPHGPPDPNPWVCKDHRHLYGFTGNGLLKRTTPPASAPVQATPRTEDEVGWIDINGVFRKNPQHSPCGRELPIRIYVPADFARDLERELQQKDARIAELESNLATLQDWKDSVMSIESSWDCQAVGKLLNVPLGHAIHPAIEPGIRKLLANQVDLTLIRVFASHVATSHSQECIRAAARQFLHDNPPPSQP